MARFHSFAWMVGIVFSLCLIVTPNGQGQTGSVVGETISLIKIDIDQPDLPAVASNLHLDIERGTEEYVYCFATEDQLTELSNKGIIFDVEYQDYRDATAWVHALFDFGEYHTPDEVFFFMDSVATANPDITVLDTIGWSVEGRVIQAMIVSDNPEVEEDEPEVRIDGAHHGNELPSVELPLYLIDYLTTSYGSNPQVTTMVNEMEIWIIPLVNPDGVFHNTRNNANDQNLNRDYLCPEGDYCLEGADSGDSFSEPETQAMRSTHEENRFVLSLTMHTRNAGPPLICWPWGYDDILHPSGSYHATEDDGLLLHICATYANLNTTPGFYIINGNDWYAVHGDACDYAYAYWGDIGCTLEISGEFAPPEEEIEQYWLDNKEAVMYYISMANAGIRGIITDASSGDPLDAVAKVIGPGREVYTDPPVGDYHRVLLPGTYGMRYECPGYISQNIYGISVFGNQATRVDVYLQPAEQVEIDLAVVDTISGENIAARVHLKGVTFETIYDDDGTGYDLVLPSDIYYAEVYADGCAPFLGYLEVPESGSYEISLLPFSDVIFSDDFESGLGNWTFGGPGNQWGLYSPGYESDNCLADSPPGDYYNNANTWMESIHQPDLTGFVRAGMYYRIKYEIETHYDMAVLEYSTDGGGNWFNLGDTLTGTSHGVWEYMYADFDIFCQEEVTSLTWGFRLAADGSIREDGIYIDNVIIAGIEESVCGYYIIGDYNGSGVFNVADIVDGYSKLKTGSPEPAYTCECPYGSGNEWAVAMDVNNSCAFNVADIVDGYSKLKTGSPELVPCEECPPDSRSPRNPDQPVVKSMLESNINAILRK